MTLALSISIPHPTPMRSSPRGAEAGAVPDSSLRAAAPATFSPAARPERGGAGSILRTWFAPGSFLRLTLAAGKPDHVRIFGAVLRLLRAFLPSLRVQLRQKSSRGIAKLFRFLSSVFRHGGEDRERIRQGVVKERQEFVNE